jgi:hypothetical protein
MATIQIEGSVLAELISPRLRGTLNGNPKNVEDVFELSVNFPHVRDPQKFSFELL